MSDVNYSTLYYRNNKKQRNIVHCCPHCPYETVYAKTNLRVHILAMHTLEKDRPFQCPEDGCCRGFAQKYQLQKHLLKKHDKNVNLSRGKGIEMYILSPGKFRPSGQKTISRCIYYGKHPVMKREDFPIRCENQMITRSHLRYDAGAKYISLVTYTKNELKVLRATGELKQKK